MGDYSLSTLWDIMMRLETLESDKMIETGVIVQKIKDLQARADALRGYL